MLSDTNTDASTHTPAGAIPRTQPYRSDKAFLSAVEPDYALINYTDARRLLKRGETADSWFPDRTQVITTTTVRDEELNLITWERELERVLEFEPDWHIPTDYSTYEDQNEEERITATLDCMEGLLWMQRQLREHGSETQIIPLVKGTTELERQACYNVFDEAGFDDLCAYYCTQYFTSGNGIQIDELVEDVRALAREQDRDIFLIGLLSANYLGRMPAQVTAAAGQNAWRKPIAPTTTEDEEIKRQWDEIVEEVEAALDSEPETDETAVIATEEA
ncbi:hypothetical protein [Halocatena marina]|uniref:hypothetical protein n=1 Tax=Halocatena marina TaxID=2934937 RepID=UPI00200D265D|nr:hypothetical protein [Halocatena marina]